MFLVVALVTITFLVYLLNQYKHSFWLKRGFPQAKPKFLVGDIGTMITQKESFGQCFETLYRKYGQHPALGIYFSYKPTILVNGPVLLQNVMIRDFNKFHDRPVPFDLRNDPLQNHLFHLSGQEWRDLRVKLTPTFTSGKLKGMFPIIRNCGIVLDEYLRKHIDQGVNTFEFRDLMARYNMNIISSVAFGIENDCINEPDHIFRRMAAKNFDVTWRTTMRNLIAAFAPKLFHILKLKIVEPDVEEFIFSIVKQTVDHRKKNNVERKDFMQLLIQLMDEGYVSVDKNDHVEGEVKKLSFNDMAAQVFVFFVAGSDTSSSTMSHCLFELAKNPEKQRKVLEEIDGVCKKIPQEEVTYDMMNEMKYLECCIDETLRKYPIVPLLFRTCTDDYTIPETSQTIPKGTGVMIPVLGFHRDPEIYDNPMEFRPERFLNSAHGGNEDVKGLFYLPFGDGPRNCIGMRMGKLTAKVGLMNVLRKFSIELEDKTMADKELELNPKQFVLTPLKDFHLRITTR